MKYITEEELRDLFGIQAFETFTLTEGVRLTPGGRQFLIDRKIPIIVNDEKKAIKTVSIHSDSSDRHTEECDDDYNNVADKRYIEADFALLEAVFFRQSIELFDINPALANQIFDMVQGLESIACNCDVNIIIVPKPCDGMSGEQLKCPQKRCFQISRDIMYEDKGKEAAILHLLRCELHKFYRGNDKFFTKDQKINLSYLMNRLSQMIHRSLGRDHCLKDTIE